MTTKLKSPDTHFIQIDIDFATEYGLNEAILCGKLLRLADVLTGYTDDDGNKWIRLTADEWAKELPFMADNKNHHTIRRTIESLESKNILFSKSFTGRPKWYRLNPDYVYSKHNVSDQNGHIQPEAIDQNGHIDGGICPNWSDVNDQNGHLPIIHSYTIDKNSINRESELTPLSQKILDICQLDLEVVKRRKTLREDFLFTAKFLTEKGITPAAVIEFNEWRQVHHWTKTGTVGLMQVCEFWPQYEAWVKAGRPAYKNGANGNVKHKQDNRPEFEKRLESGQPITPEEIRRQLSGG